MTSTNPNNSFFLDDETLASELFGKAAIQNLKEFPNVSPIKRLDAYEDNRQRYQNAMKRWRKDRKPKHHYDLRNKFLSVKEFKKLWIEQQGGTGLKYNDQPGCYVILIFKNQVKDNNWSAYDDVYVGQSENMYQRVRNHFSGKGNGDVYADIKYGKYAYVQFFPCPKQELNNLEKGLIASYDATSSYNKTNGGAYQW